MLSEVLKKYHDAIPVHTGAELKMLAERFPENIKLYTGEVDDKILAGAVVFENGDTVHTQYLANSDEGRNIGALDCVIDYLLRDVYADKKYFDFGISNENAGRYLNCGLIAQKEGFGARAVVHDFYELTISREEENIVNYSQNQRGGAVCRLIFIGKICVLLLSVKTIFLCAACYKFFMQRMCSYGS